jgi:hypothetical protein
MATEKRKPGKTRKSPPAGAEPASFSSFMRLAAAPPESSDFPALLAKQGLAPEIGTVVYIHGINNKPVASVLKCQWDSALFGTAMGDRTRMAYWVNRARYPVPSSDSCAAKDGLSDFDPGLGTRGLAAEVLDTGPELSDPQRQLMASLEQRLLEPSSEEGGPAARVLPLPAGMRRWIVRQISRLFLKDVRDFFFDTEERERMEKILLERLMVGGGPFIVIGHSQGSMIAYQVLRKLQKLQCDVRLFLTIGSPLGLQEVQDMLVKLEPGRPLAVPDCVDRWLNVAERLDPVALDADLSNDYGQNPRGVGVENIEGLRINPEWESNPHSGTGYLSIDAVRQAVRDTAGANFSNLVGRAILMKDLVSDLEDGKPEQRLKIVIDLVCYELK